MFGWWRLFRGLLRHNLLFAYYNALENGSTFIGILCWLWANNCHVTWIFDVNEEVQIKHTKYIGIVCCLYEMFGEAIYEIKINKRYYAYCEQDIIKTDLKIYSKVYIKEICFKNLKDGNRYFPVEKPQYQRPFYPSCYPWD